MAMDIFLDTNILVRVINQADPDHEVARNAIHRCLSAGDELIISPQVEREFLHTATRPAGKANGLGIEPREAVRKLESLEQAYCSLKPDPLSAAQRTKELIAQFALSDTRVHDAAIAASAEAHGGKLLTFNTKHFQQFQDKGIFTLLAPKDLAQEYAQRQGQEEKHEQRPEPGPPLGHHQDRDSGHEH